MNANDQISNAKLQTRIDDLTRQLAAAQNSDEEARIDVELSQLMYQQQLEKSPAQIEAENLELMQQFDEGKLFDFRDIIKEFVAAE